MTVSAAILALQAMCGTAVYAQESAVAIVRAYEQANLSAPISSNLASLNVTLGQSIAKGDQIAAFDCEQLKAEGEVLEVEMQGAEIEKELQAFAVANQTGSAIELRRAQNAFNLAKARLHAHNSLLQKCTIMAPFDGVVSDILVREHERVPEGTPIIVLTNPQSAFIESRIPAKWLELVETDKYFVFKGELSGIELRFEVHRSADTIDEVSQTVKVEGRIISGTEYVQIGQSGIISLSD